MKSNRVTLILLLMAIITGGGGYYLATNYIKGEVTEYKAELDRGQQMVPVVVAARDLKMGEKIDNKNVAVRSMPREYLHKGYISPNAFDAIVGSIVAHPLAAGDPVLHANLGSTSALSFSDLLKKDERAVTIPVSRFDTANGFLEPGDHIDIMITMKDGPRSRTLTLLEDVKVIATDRKLETDPREQANYTMITMGLNVKDATRLIHAQTVGDLSVLLRGTGEGMEDSLEDEYITIDNLVDVKQEVISAPVEVKQKPVGFQVIKGGKS